VSKLKTVSARLSIEMNVTCPNPDCETSINLLDQRETNDFWHDDDAVLLKQMFPTCGDHSKFECDDVTCTKCKTTFNVRELEW